MTIVKFNQRPAKSFNNLMDDFFTTMPSLFRDDAGNGIRHQVPVNIRETGQGYQLEVFAPGLKREDFNINLEQNTLTVSAEKKEESTDEKHIRREYRFQSFKRSFHIGEHIDVENITAKYENGVLTLNLPGKAEVKETVKQISVQ